MLRKIRSLATIAGLLVSSIVSAAATTPASPVSQEQSRNDVQQQLAAAHERLELAAREVAELSAQLPGDPDTLMFMHRNPKRAMLGVGIGGDNKNGSDGVRVVSVSPGGPAAGVGLKADDIIVELNGTSLKADTERDANQKLLAVMAKVAPGDEVSLSYRRDGKVRAVKLKAEPLPRNAGAPLRFERRILRGEHGPFDEHGAFDQKHEFEFLRGPVPPHMGSFGAIELVPLSPKLGQYFGTEKGLLVVRSPQGKTPNLEDGDVLIDIDGRAPANPSHAFRILGSYQPGEKVTLNVLRQRKKMSIAIVVPDHEQRGPRPPVPPRPPRAEQPAAPAPAAGPSSST